MRAAEEDEKDENLWDDDVYRVEHLSPDPPERMERFVNFLADIVVATVVFYVFLFFIFWVVNVTGRVPRFLSKLERFDLIWVCWYFLYMTFSEFALKGKTVGKYITNTRVVSTTGDNVNFVQVLIRSLVRIIPLEPFSIFIGKGNATWHDRWSRTKVIKEFSRPRSARKNNVVLD